MSEFCFPVTLNVPRDESSGNIKVTRGETELTVSQVINCFVIPADSKIAKTAKNDLLDTCGGCTCSASGSETELSTETTRQQSFTSQLTKNKDNT